MGFLRDLLFGKKYDGNSHSALFLIIAPPNFNMFGMVYNLVLQYAESQGFVLEETENHYLRDFGAGNAAWSLPDDGRLAVNIDDADGSTGVCVVLRCKLSKDEVVAHVDNMINILKQNAKNAGYEIY